MSISAEIERLRNAKAGIEFAITKKGVDVPAGTKLDGMADLIDLIPSGGGGTGGGGSIDGFRSVDSQEAHKHREMIVLLTFKNSENGSNNYYVLYSNEGLDQESRFVYRTTVNTRGYGLFEEICRQYGKKEFEYAENIHGNVIACKADGIYLFDYDEGEVWDLADWLWVDFFVRD